MEIKQPAIKQGQIWWADLTELPDSEAWQRCPVLVVQSDAFNRSTLQTAVCVVLSNNWRLAEAPGNILVSQADSGLDKATVANVAHLITLEKRFLNDHIGTLPPWVMESILDGIELLLGR